MDHHRNGQAVVGVDGSLPSLAAAEWAAATAASLGAALTVLRVRMPPPAIPADADYGGPALPTAR